MVVLGFSSMTLLLWLADASTTVSGCSHGARTENKAEGDVMDAGYTFMRGHGKFRVGNGTNGESSCMDRPGIYLCPRISEIGNETVKKESPGEVRDRVYTMLAQHRSLTKTSTEKAAIKMVLHFEDKVPCKARARRRCATHPRSIAERVRRNRISDRMRNLQELVPNMDKQRNTADMLDLAVEYIKNLQDDFKVLRDKQAKCKCINLQ